MLMFTETERMHLLVKSLCEYLHDNESRIPTQMTEANFSTFSVLFSTIHPPTNHDLSYQKLITRRPIWYCSIIDVLISNRYRQYIKA